jgi:hypothetical protein
MAQQEDESTIGTVRDLAHEEPFLPFLIVMASGDRCVIEDPDALAITPSQLHYYPRNGKGIHMRVNQIAAVEQFGEKPAA